MSFLRPEHTWFYYRVVARMVEWEDGVIIFKMPMQYS